MSGFLHDFAGKRSAGLIGPSTAAEVERCRKCGSILTPIDRTDEWDSRVGEHGELRCSDVTCRLSDMAPVAPPTPLPPTRQDPEVGDLVVWHDGSTGIVAHVRESWIDPGEAVVYRHAEQAHPGAQTYMVEAGSLVADHALPTGATVFTYRGSLR